MKPGLLFVFILLILCGPSAICQTADIWIDLEENYSQRDTFFNVSVRCDAFFDQVKAIRLDIEVNPAILSFDTTANGVNDTIIVRPGGLFNFDDSITFFAYYLHPDSVRITLDMAYLPDSATINGPGEIMILPITTVGFGESDITIVNAFLIDKYGQNIPVNVTHAWAKVCQFVGDLNADNRIDIADLVYFVDYSFGTPTGPEPMPLASADVDCSSQIDIADIVYLVNYMFYYGPPPCETCL